MTESEKFEKGDRIAFIVVGIVVSIVGIIFLRLLLPTLFEFFSNLIIGIILFFLAGLFLGVTASIKGKWPLLAVVLAFIFLLSGVLFLILIISPSTYAAQFFAIDLIMSGIFVTGIGCGKTHDR